MTAAALALVVLPPLAFWMPWEDCFPLAKWMALAVFGGLVVAQSGSLRRPATGAWAWLAPWTGWVVVAAATGPAITSPWRGWMEAVLLALPPWTAVAVAGRVAAPRLASLLLVAAVIMAAYAVAQLLGLESGGWLSPFHKGVASTAGNPDLLGGALLLPFALAAARWRDRPDSPLRALVALLIGLAIAATEARAAWLGAAVAAGVVLARGPWRRLLMAAGLAAVVFAGLVAAVPGAAGRLRSTGALAERVWTWRLALAALREHPVAGTGPSSFRSVYLAAQADRHDRGETFSHYTEYAHLEPLHLAVELGLVGLGLALWAGGCAWRTLRAGLCGAGWVRDGTRAGAVAVAADALLSWPLHVAATAVPLWIMLAAAGSRRPPEPAGRLRILPALALLPLLAFAFRPAYGSGVLRLGFALSGMGRFGDAGVWHDRALRTGAGEFRLHWQAAVAARSRGDLDRAATSADAAIALEPGIAELRLERAAVARAARQPALAEAALREALRLDPGLIHAWNNLGNLLGEQGRLAEAEAAQRRAVALAPDSADARRNLAVTLLRRGRSAEARRLLEGGR